VTSRRSDSGLDGILLIDKPIGWTSHDVVAKARRITGQRRIGHTGTLDPMASGLLVLCLGRATRLVEYLTGHDKRYRGTITLGRNTTTDDAEGEVTLERPVPDIKDAALEAVLAGFQGAIQQRPPAFSALKVDGKRAYVLAREGADPALPPRPVTIHEITGAFTSATEIDLTVHCSAGTYIRSLARDMGEVLGCGGHLSALRRLSAGPFQSEDAFSLAQVDAAVEAGELEPLVLPADEGLLEFEAAILGSEGVAAVAHGVAWIPPLGPLRSADRLRIYGHDGTFVAVGSLSTLGEIRPSKVFLRNKSGES